jgi:hypothetical protein
MTEKEFEDKMYKSELEMEYVEYIMDRHPVGNVKILIRLMECGDCYEGFKEKMVT